MLESLVRHLEVADGRDRMADDLGLLALQALTSPFGHVLSH